jgi:hypothetical protein
VTRRVPCSKRITDLQGEESKERDVEDGWVDTESPVVKDLLAGREAADIDDMEEMKMENVGGNAQDEEAVSF